MDGVDKSRQAFASRPDVTPIIRRVDRGHGYDHRVDEADLGPTLRLATAADHAAIDELMKVSTRDLFPAFYDERETASGIEHIAHVDAQLIEDGTYFVIEEAGELIACGGWSRRDKLFTGEASQEGRAELLDPATQPARVRAMFVRPDRTRRGSDRILEACREAAREEGFTRLALAATLPGEQLYERFGFVAEERFVLTMPDGVTLEAVAMSMPLDPFDRWAGGIDEEPGEIDEIIYRR